MMDWEQLWSDAPRTGFPSSAKGDTALAARAVERRGLLRIGIGLLGALWLGRSFGLRGGSLAATTLERWLRDVGSDRLGDPRALSQLGAAYLASHPAERDSQHLAQLILGNRVGPVPLLLIDRIARDWIEHDVTQVEGWVLSRTEARTCAVLHLMDGRAG